MPLSEIHRKKLKKNLAVIGLIVLWCALIWMVTMIRIAHAADLDRSLVGPMEASREKQLQKSMNTELEWHNNYTAAAPDLLQKEESADEASIKHLNSTDAATENWDENWATRQEARYQLDAAEDERRAARLMQTEQAPEEWWNAWLAHDQAKEP